jgi:hypothetical protein
MTSRIVPFWCERAPDLCPVPDTSFSVEDIREAAHRASALAVSHLAATTAREVSIKADVERLAGIVLKYWAVWMAEVEDGLTAHRLDGLLNVFGTALGTSHDPETVCRCIVGKDDGGWPSAIRQLPREKGPTPFEVRTDRNVLKNRLRSLRTRVSAA